MLNAIAQVIIIGLMFTTWWFGQLLGTLLSIFLIVLLYVLGATVTKPMLITTANNLFFSEEIDSMDVRSVYGTLIYLLIIGIIFWPLVPFLIALGKILSSFLSKGD